MPPSRHRAWLLAGIPFALLTLGLGAEEPTPWPLGGPPSSSDLSAWIADEERIADRERFEEYLEAAERGEDTEHMTVRQEDIDAGLFTLERIFLYGDAAFGHEFRRENGYGRTELPRMARVHDGASGGLDGFSCSGCHQQGGVNGAGSVTANSFYFGDGEHASSAIVRNPPNVLGLGLVQKLAQEMSALLRYQRDTAIAEAVQGGAPIAVQLESHGVSFGSITARPDGTIDSAKLEGIDDDLIVKPFGWKGHTASLRRFAERAALVHFGVQSHVLALAHKDAPDPALGNGPNWWDPDGDGVQRELQEGTLTAYAIYMEMLEAPMPVPPSDPALAGRAATGRQLFQSIGCAGCHRESLQLSTGTWYEQPDTTGGPPVVVQLLKDGEQPRGGLEVQLFSDLKRHSMGEALADPHDDPDGIGRDVFLTRPLWGLAESGPYLHDGRASTIHEAVAQHGGEAASARDLFLGLTPVERQDIELFLLSLSRLPRLRVPQ